MPKRIEDLKKRIPGFLRSSSELPQATVVVDFIVDSPKSLQSLAKLDSNEPASPNKPILEHDVIPNSQAVEIPLISTSPAGPDISSNSLDKVHPASPQLELASSQIQSKQESPLGSATIMPSQADVPKRVWVKRQGASATLIQITEDDLVDDVREKILRKYANSLGRTFDSPDVTLRIIPRADSHGHYERSLGPEEAVAAILSQYFPAGQTIEEALIIDIPHRRTPRQSPRVYVDHHHRPVEDGGDYFSVMPVAVTRPPHINTTSAVSTIPQPPMHTISVLNTGQIPSVPLPSPGATSRRHTSHRPKYGRTATSSPTVLSTNGAHITSHIDRIPPTPGIAPLPTPPITTVTLPKATTPPSRADSPRLVKAVKPKKPKKQATGSSQPPTLLDGGVPPISVLIVEDNIINLRLLEAFMKRLKVRWQTAMNGRDAVTKWRTGGFHLVLMDIQLPIMNGLEATREIRRLERVNSIGVLSAKTEDTTDPTAKSEKADESDKLPNMDQFKSPVIVVALTASSLQSDRHEALAAGCNDFLTKPVNFVWLERKVMEWGCMQALIDFDGWRKWKDFTQPARATTKSTKAAIANTIPSATGSSATPKINRFGKASNSSSSDANETLSNSKPAIPNTLVALNDKVESGDTVGSADSLNSDDSIETLDLKSSRRSPLIPQSASFSSVGSTGSTSTVVPSRNTISHQSSSQSLRTVTGRDSLPNSPTRTAVHTTSIGSVVSTKHEESRRHKRSSLGRPGLSGVTEEVEGIGAV